MGNIISAHIVLKKYLEQRDVAELLKYFILTTQEKEALKAVDNCTRLAAVLSHIQQLVAGLIRLSCEELQKIEPHLRRLVALGNTATNHRIAVPVFYTADMSFTECTKAMVKRLFWLWGAVKQFAGMFGQNSSCLQYATAQLQELVHIAVLLDTMNSILSGIIADIAVVKLVLQKTFEHPAQQPQEPPAQAFKESKILVPIPIRPQVKAVRSVQIRKLQPQKPQPRRVQSDATTAPVSHAQQTGLDMLCAAAELTPTVSGQKRSAPDQDTFPQKRSAPDSGS